MTLDYNAAILTKNILPGARRKDDLYPPDRSGANDLLKRLPLYPFLFILDVILTPLAHNLNRLDPSQALRPLLILWLAAAGILLLFYLLFRDWQYAGYLVFLICLFLFSFAYLNRFLQVQLLNFGKALDERVFLLICATLLGMLAVKGVWIRLGGRTGLTAYLNLLIVVMLLVPTYELVSGLIREPLKAIENPGNAQTGSGGMPLDCSSTPDIYYIILDGYGRADSLADLYGLDNQPFLETLSRKGFYVATESYTNYTQTIFSVPAALNFNFIDPPGKGVSGSNYFTDMISHNEIMATLKRCGYQTVAIESGFYFTDHPEVDIFLARSIGTNEFEDLLLADSPVDVLSSELNLEPPENSYAAHRQRVLYSFKELGKLPQMTGPKFVFAHIISPHPPFVFDKLGQPIEPKPGYYIGDGDDYRGTLEEYLAGYPEQVQFVNQKIEQVIDAILANSAQPPVIIIQGDHGPGSRLDWGSPQRTCLWERTPILNAYYLPEGGDSLLYPSISPVNSFRVVLNKYFGTNLPLLPDDTYFTSHRLERQAIDITAQRSSLANCDLP